MSFKDYFSAHAADYARYRPTYPRDLFAYLASVAPGRGLAWDCATGNGQAAVGLADFFARVVATDPSSSQIENAAPHGRVTYRVAPAERTDIAAQSVDLVAVAQALHWFNLEEFYAEARRVLREEGVVAVWCYNLLEVSPGIDERLNRFYRETVGPFWPPERWMIEDGYRSLAFPFRELNAPPFSMEVRWSLAALVGYLRTWSATKRYVAARGEDPLESLTEELLPLWGRPEEERRVVWPLHLRAGRA